MRASEEVRKEALRNAVKYVTSKGGNLDKVMTVATLFELYILNGAFVENEI